VDIIARLYAKFGIPVYLVWDLDRRGGKCSKKVNDRNGLLASIATNGRQKSGSHKTGITADYACFESTLTEAMSDELLACGALLNGLKEHRSLERAAEADRQPSPGAGREHCACHECQRLPHLKRSARPAIAARKRALKGKLGVFRVLERIRERDGEKFESHTVVRIVRKLEELGDCRGDHTSQK